MHRKIICCSKLVHRSRERDLYTRPTQVLMPHEENVPFGPPTPTQRVRIHEYAACEPPASRNPNPTPRKAISFKPDLKYTNPASCVAFSGYFTGRSSLASSFSTYGQVPYGAGQLDLLLDSIPCRDAPDRYQLIRPMCVLLDMTAYGQGT